MLAQALPYDIHSIMHYDPFAYSSNGRATMTLYPQGCLLSIWEKQDMPTIYDYLHINLLYCHGKFTFLTNLQIEIETKISVLIYCVQNQ